jgi:acyl carrier protein
LRKAGGTVDRIHIIQELNGIFEEIIDRGTVRLSETTVPADVDGWDSLAHIQLVVAVEKRFDIKFTSDEILSWKNIGDMVECISNTLSLSTL